MQCVQPHVQPSSSSSGNRSLSKSVVQVKDSAMLSKIQGMVGTASPLGATVAQIRDRLTAVTR